MQLASVSACTESTTWWDSIQSQQFLHVNSVLPRSVSCLRYNGQCRGMAFTFSTEHKYRCTSYSLKRSHGYLSCSTSSVYCLFSVCISCYLCITGVAQSGWKFGNLSFTWVCTRSERQQTCSYTMSSSQIVCHPAVFWVGLMTCVLCQASV